MNPLRRSSPSVKMSKPSSLLTREHAQDVSVLDRAQLLGRHAGIAAGVEHLRRAQKAADVSAR